MRTGKISTFMLERYKLGELSSEDTITVKDALAADHDLRLHLEKLDESDRELRLRWPAEFFGLGNLPSVQPQVQHVKTRVYQLLIAAAVLLCVLLPVFYFLRNGLKINNSIAVASALSGPQTDRAKGQVPAGCALSIYLQGDREIILSDQTALQEGNTIQLAYTVPAGPQHYGVIFSIDGRSGLTMHYPYRKGQSSLLVSGKSTFLNEAYTLDDAPDYEVFVFVVSEVPLDAEVILHEAQEIAEKAEVPDHGSIAEKSKIMFEGCEVETVTVLKK